MQLQVEGVHEVSIDAQECQAHLRLSPDVRIRHVMETVRLMVTSLHLTRPLSWKAALWGL